MHIRVLQPTQEQIEEAKKWPVWEKEPSEFPWEYSEEETFYVLEGRAKVKTDTEEVKFGAGDVVVMPKGLKCTWIIEEKIKKHYRFA